MTNLVIQNEFDKLIQEATDTDKIINNDLKSNMFLREVTKDEITEILRQGGPNVTGLKHEITSKEIHHALKRHGQSNESEKYPGQRPLTKDDVVLIPSVIDSPTQIIVKLRGKNRTSIIYSKDFHNCTIYYVERIIETSIENKPRLTTKTAWVRVANTGVKSSTTAVYTPLRNSNILHSNGSVKHEFQNESRSCLIVKPVFPIKAVGVRQRRVFVNRAHQVPVI